MRPSMYGGVRGGAAKHLPSPSTLIDNGQRNCGEKAATEVDRAGRETQPKLEDSGVVFIFSYAQKYNSAYEP